MMWRTDTFLDYLLYERAYAVGTIRNYREDICLFEQFVVREQAEATPAEVTAEMVREWIVELMDAGYAPGTVNKMLSSLRSFFKYLLRTGAIEVDPMQKVKGPKRKKPLPVFLKESDMDRLLDETDFGEGFKGHRDHAIIEMFYTTGMRRAELIGLNDADIDFAARVIRVTGKRNKQRLIPFDEALKQSMEAYIACRNEAVPVRSEAFFVRENGGRLTANNVEYLVRKQLSKVVTQKKRSPHVLRHTFATVMLNNEAELGAVKELLGHESLTTTEVYTHTTFEELKKVYNQAHPRA